MKQMNKEELIYCFMNTLKDNQYLKDIISTDEIKARLNETISEVIYDNKETKNGKTCFCSSKQDGTVIITLSDKINEAIKDLYIVHELLHAISMSKIEATAEYLIHKCGLEFHFGHVENQNYIVDHKQDEAINEGMTQAITERIIKAGTNFSYNTEKDIAKIISVILGEKTMLQKYFSSTESCKEDPNYIPIEDLKKRYGQDIGFDFCDKLEKISPMADELLKLNKDDEEKNKEQIDILKNEIYKILENMIDKMIEVTPDIRERITDIMNPLFQTTIGLKYSSKIMPDFYNSSDIDKEEKKKLGYDIINKYCELAPYGQNGIDGKFILETYIKSGIISQENWNKKKALSKIMNGTRLNEIMRKIEKIQYKQIGDYYMILGDYNIAENEPHKSVNGKLFDKDGNEVSIEREELDKLKQRRIKTIYK